MEEKITFSFGENWCAYAEGIDEEDIQSSIKEICTYFSVADGFDAGEFFKDKTVLDIGCGSGIHSLAFYMLGAKQVVSFDYDPRSVEATQSLRAKFDAPANWTVQGGNVLSEEFMNSLGAFDIVYSWGVLHHTGDMWKALKNSLIPLKENGYYYIALYIKTDRYEKDLKLKRKYNAGSRFRKKQMETLRVLRHMVGDVIKRRQNPFKWNRKTERGMRVYTDIVDWLGGLPYETATVDEVLDFGVERELQLLKLSPVYKEACQTYFFLRRAH